MEGTDLIEVRGLQVEGRHGVADAEREHDQPFVVSLAVRLDTREAAAFDDINATLDYAEAVRQVTAVVRGESVQLIETLADRIARKLLANKRVLDIWVRIAKPNAPLGDAVLDEVAVEISRSRDDMNDEISLS